MARKSKVWWWKARQRWAANIEGKRHVAPASIKEQDQIAATRWYQRQKARVSMLLVSSVTLAALCESYLEWDEGRTRIDQRDLRAHRSMRSKLTTVCEMHLDTHQVGDLSIEEFTPGHIQAMINAWIGEGRQPSYVCELAASTKTVFRWACRQVEMRPAILDENPARGLVLPEVPNPDPRFADPVEAAAWLRWLRRNGKHPSYIKLQRFLIHTGARPSEFTRARYGEVDWTNWQVVRRKWKSARKTKKSRRIYVPKRLRRSLWRGFVAADRNKGVLLFVTPRGLEWSATNLSTTTQRYREEAIADGLALCKDGPDRLTCYRWRHTAASTLLMDGVDIATVAELLGTSVDMVQKHYGHILPGHLAAAAERLANRRVPPVSEPRP